MKHIFHISCIIETDSLDKENVMYIWCLTFKSSKNRRIWHLSNNQNIISLLETLKKGYGDFNRLITDTINHNILNKHHLITPSKDTEHPLSNYLKLIE